MPTRREQQRETTLETIKQVARAQMAHEGTAGLSLRGIARDMEVTAPALYRYYPSRDDLITALILDGFNALADAMIAADAAQPRPAYGERIYAIFCAYRDWALANPVDFQLIYGNPIPGFHAPAEVTVPAVVRGFIPMTEALTEAYAAAVLRPPAHFQHLPHTVDAFLRAFADSNGYPVPPEVFAVMAHAWTMTHGMVVLEMHRHTPSLLGDTTAFFQHQIKALCRELNLTVR
ncbi:MAG: TetR/AcrR family transcriptional regulator [Chloroflexota bacterium]|nr:TetR/AcrR family transcriptional regulator [Chloroflexota bacterium]